MPTNALATQPQSQPSAQTIEQVLMGGDLKGLTEQQRVEYVTRLCESLGLNPLQRPFQYIELSGKLTLYARKDATDQMRARNNISVSITNREFADGLYIVTAQATTPAGRIDESIGAVVLPQSGEARANALMKAEAKAKRRVTLSICGLGILDESEMDTIKGAEAQVVAAERIEQFKQLPAAAPEKKIKKETPPSNATINSFGTIREEIFKAMGQPICPTCLGTKGTPTQKCTTCLGTGQDNSLYFTVLKGAGYDKARDIPTEKEAVRVYGLLGDELARLKHEDSLRTDIMAAVKDKSDMGQRMVDFMTANYPEKGLGDIGVAELEKVLASLTGHP